MRKEFLPLLICMILVTTPVLVPVRPKPTVTTFQLTQTYYQDTGFYRGPAIYYRQTVTVEYEGTNRYFWDPDEHHFNLQITGLAKVYAGESTDGNLIDERKFKNAEEWVDPYNTWGWPARWWMGGVEALKYKWTIPGVYDFTVQAEGNSDGITTWHYKQVAYTCPKTVVNEGTFTVDPPS